MPVSLSSPQDTMLLSQAARSRVHHLHDSMSTGGCLPRTFLAGRPWAAAPALRCDSGAGARVRGPDEGALLTLLARLARRPDSQEAEPKKNAPNPSATRGVTIGTCPK